MGLNSNLEVTQAVSRLQKQFRNLCNTVKCCLGISSTGSITKFINQRGQWVEEVVYTAGDNINITNNEISAVLPFEGEITVGGDEYFFGVGNFLGNDTFGTLINNGTALQGWIDGFGFFQNIDFGLLGSSNINSEINEPKIIILLADATNEFAAIFEPTTIKFEDLGAPSGEGYGLLLDLTTHNFISEWVANFDFANDVAAAAGGVEIDGFYHNNGDVKIRLT